MKQDKLIEQLIEQVRILNIKIATMEDFLKSKNIEWYTKYQMQLSQSLRRNASNFQKYVDSSASSH